MDEQLNTNTTQKKPTEKTKASPLGFNINEERKAERNTVRNGSKLPVLVVLLLLVVFAGVIAYLILNREGDTPSVVEDDSITEETALPQVDTTPIQANVTAWIEGMNTQGSFFNSQESCATANTCQVSGQEQNVIALWSLYNQEISTGNIQQAQQTIASISAVTTPNRPWSCHFLYDIATTGDVSEDQMTSIQQACQTQATPSSSQVAQQEITAKIQEIMGGEEAPPAGDATIFQESAPDRLEALSAQTSTNAINTLWNEADVQSARASFDEALSYYTSQQEEIASKAPLLSLASLDMYRATEDAIYLEFAEYLYNVHLSPSCITLSGCANFLYLTHVLGGLTGGQQYAQYNDVLTESILKTSYDGTQYANKFGKNAFYTINDERIIYPTHENALILGTFAKN